MRAAVTQQYHSWTFLIADQPCFTDPCTNGFVGKPIILRAAMTDISPEEIRMADKKRTNKNFKKMNNRND